MTKVVMFYNEWVTARRFADVAFPENWTRCEEERKIVTLTGDLTCKTREDVNAQVTLDTQVKLAEKIRLEKL